MKLTNALRSSIAQIIIDGVANGTADSPIIEVYTGTIPASMGLSISDTRLAELTMTNTVATENNGVITFDAITDDSAADASGTAGWARLLDRDGSEVIHVTVSEIDGTGELQFASVSFQAGNPVSVSSAVLTVGG
jgi:hypothetical protein